MLGLWLGEPVVTQTGECGEVDLSSRLAALLETSEADGEGWSVDAELRGGGAQTVVDLRIVDSDGGVSTRTLTSSECSVAVDAAAFIVASAIDPTIAAPEPTADPEPEPEPVAVPEPELAPEVDVEPEPEPEPPAANPGEPGPPPDAPAGPRRRPQVWVGLGPSVMGGALPSPVGRLLVFAALEGAYWRVRIDGAATLRADARSTQVGSVGARLGQWSVGGRGCGVLPIGRVGMSACAGAEVGQLYAEGFGFEAATSTRLPWGAALGSLGLHVDVARRVRLLVDADVGAVLNRASVFVDNLERLHRLGPVFGRGSLGVAVRF